MEIKFESKLYERFLLFITNTSFFLMVLSVISDFLNSFGKNNPVNFLHYIFIFGISLAYFLIFENSFSSKSKGANQIRFFIFFILFIGFLCFIFRAIINGFIMIPLSSAMFFTSVLFFKPFFIMMILRNSVKTNRGINYKLSFLMKNSLVKIA